MDGRRARLKDFWIPVFMIAVGSSMLVGYIARGLPRGNQADVTRWWVVSQYVRQGVDPYPVALKILRQVYGPIEQVKLKDIDLLEIPNPQNAEALGVIPVGPPEATYPPPALLFQTALIGFIPKPMVVAYWMTCNFALLIFCAWMLSRHLSNGIPTPSRRLWTLALFVLWMPALSVFLSSQLSLLALACLLVAFEKMDTNEVISGLALTLALIKPSLTLPFLILPLVRGRWKVLAIALGIQGILTLLMAARVGSSPLDLARNWMGVARYFSVGMYSLQGILVKRGLENRPIATVFLMTMLGMGLLVSWIGRRSDPRRIFYFLCFLDILVFYHRRYDFVLLFAPLCYEFFGRSDPNIEPARTWRIVPRIALYLVVDMAVWWPFIEGNGFLMDSFRRFAFVAMIGLFAESGVRLLIDGYRDWKGARPQGIVVIPSKPQLAEV